jgi:nucleoid-associated protein YejK
VKTEGFFVPFSKKGVNNTGRRIFKGMENGDKSKDFLRFQVNRKVTNLYKNFLFMVEDLYNSGDLDEESFQRIRKRILDYGNDTIREIEENLDNFEFKLK